MFKNKVVEDFYESMTVRNPEGILKFFSKEASLTFPEINPIGGFYLGQDKIKRFIKKLFMVFPDISFTVYLSASEDQITIVEWGFSGTTKKGQPIEGKGASIFEMENSLIKDMRTYMNFT